MHHFTASTPADSNLLFIAAYILPGNVRKQSTSPFANLSPPSEASTHTAPSILGSESDEETLHGSDIEFDPEGDTYSDLDHSWGPPTLRRRARPSTSKTPVHVVSAVKKGVVQRVKGIVNPKNAGVPAGAAKSAYPSDSEITAKLFSR